jgi:hypothetical protein
MIRRKMLLGSIFLYLFPVTICVLDMRSAIMMIARNLALLRHEGSPIYFYVIPYGILFMYMLLSLFQSAKINRLFAEIMASLTIPALILNLYLFTNYITGAILLIWL